ncbi:MULTISPECIES: NADPH-dependent 7-cyano-7-deazaguanine reductase [Pyrobaculum]|uniref:GTP cyclohydrolase I n=2 Tax=Pyrobaculum arsenaticum TaxID=121277 RepID=A4WMS9_PYRAR|nr:NADPH-dependent 7-cyano-7-deazaguanine reductase [Pyrobaculum arsenaticum]ABP51696.1 GTP cyclohydrolase I [Pyrobaculum arsenaticum DSM 13514]MCY0890111.1 NADPH-dependent 7-cyano-7-deazaguanine reductase [Pyrobaculum arsenaticum]NYR16015.1 NADPH-dependent 7-cyano-7-deazaguanine reductase [Pyrobaculum arsenaticum]
MLKLSKNPQLVRLKTRGESVCPISKTVDSFEVTLEYIPRGVALAIEEFKKMVDSYRGREILHEELAVDLLEKVKSVVNPPYVKVTLKSFYAGVEVEVVAESGGTQPLYI